MLLNIDAEILELAARAKAECARELDSMIGRTCDSAALRAIESTMLGALRRLHERGALADLGIHHAIDILDVRFVAGHDRGRVTLDVVAPMVEVRGAVRI